MCNSFFSFSHFPDFSLVIVFCDFSFSNSFYITFCSSTWKGNTPSLRIFCARISPLENLQDRWKFSGFFWKMWTSISRPNLGILKRQTKQSGENRMQKKSCDFKKCTLFRVPSKSYGHLKNGLWIKVSVGTRRVEAVSFVDGIYFIDVICFVDWFCEMTADWKNQTKPKQI